MNPISPAPRPLLLCATHTLALTLALAAALALGACGSTKRSARDPEGPAVVRDVPAVFRQTVGAQATLAGTEPILVAGYGFAVGLNGTGGGPLPVQVQATMERLLAMGGVGKGGPLDSGPLAGMTPRQVLADPSTAVVVVEGVITPGSPLGSAFDVRVRTFTGSSVTSLEGGQLWTTELRLGAAQPFGAAQAHKVAEAMGPIFLNPFADMESARPRTGAALDAATRPDSAAGDAARRDADRAARVAAAMNAPEDDGITRTVGRIIGGGRVTEPLSMQLTLDSPSHARAATLVAAINSRFPPGPGDDGQTARGKDDQHIVLRVPRAFRDSSADFVRLLLFTPIETSFLNEYAKRYAEELRSSAGMAGDLSWAMIAVGKPSIPFVQPMYDSAEFLPRMVALRVGAKLNDMRAVPFLKEVAAGGQGGSEYAQAYRDEAIILLGQMGFNPAIDTALRDLVNAPNLETKIAAYEAMAERGDPSLAHIRLDDRFTLDVVPSTDELVYITQQGKPRVVVFGDDVRLRSSAMVSAWGDRLMLINEPPPATPSSAPGAAAGAKAATGYASTGSADTGTRAVAQRYDAQRPVRLYYRDNRSGRVVRTNVPARLPELVRYLATKPTIEDDALGLGLSYSQVVGVLYQMQKQNAVAAAFSTEENRLMAQLLEAENTTALESRPESEGKRSETRGKIVVLKPSTAGGSAQPAGAATRTMVVPIARDSDGKSVDAPKTPKESGN